MTRARGLITLLLLAALVPVGWFGASSWRTSVEADPAPVSTVAAARPRPQVGRSTSPWALGVEHGRVPNRGPWPTVPPRGQLSEDDEEPPAEAPATPLSTEPEPLRAMMAATPSPAPEPARRPGIPPFGGFAAGPSGLAGSSAGSNGLATIQFTGLMQNLTLLQRNDFLAADVRELKITVWWNVAGTHTQRLDVFAPDGSLYRRFSVVFDANGSGGSTTPVETRLPVGGTWITEYSLFGAWRVEVYLDSQATPVAAAHVGLNS